jgi:hypothetical protein
MDRKRVTTAEAAARLAAALSAHDDLRCDEAEPLIPALLEAERAGEDVTGNPAYTALTQHLDHCEACLNLYAQLAEDLEAVVGVLEVLPAVAPAPPTFFSPPIPKGDHVLLQVLRGIVRRFTLTFDLPRLAPALATLGGQQRTLYSDTLREVAGAPLLALTAGRGPEGVWLQVAVREPSQKTTWQIRLDLGDQTLIATTDSHGIARFTLPPTAPLGEVQLHCEELPASTQHE